MGNRPARVLLMGHPGFTVCKHRLDQQFTIPQAREAKLSPVELLSPLILAAGLRPSPCSMETIPKGGTRARV